MKRNFKHIFFVVLLMILSSVAMAQATIGLKSLLDSIEKNNPVSRMYEADIRSMDEAAKGARSWMPPEIGAGFFMTPYTPQRWKKMSDMEPGMGNFMIAVQQMIPNKKKLNADAAYMESMSGPAKEQQQTALNELYAQAKTAYFDWIIIEKKILAISENEKVLEFMIGNAETRYKNGLGKINAYYKAKAALGQVQNMRIMLHNEREQRRILLNTLMNLGTEFRFAVDTGIQLKDYSDCLQDSSRFVNNRSDLKAIDREIVTNQLRILSERQALKPQFGVRFEHMFAFGAQPQQFTLMGMVRLPIAPWASRMNRANMESYIWRTEALNSQRQMILNETRGMAAGMRTELEGRKRQVKLYENNIIPALRNNYRTMLLGYEQNTEELFMLFDAWESLNMAQMEYLDQLQQLLFLQVALEKILQIKL